MEILKPGSLKKKTKEFSCNKCGCVFIADETEYQDAPSLACVKDGIEAECKCPTCGKIVYR